MKFFCTLMNNNHIFPLKWVDRIVQTMSIHQPIKTTVHHNTTSTRKIQWINTASLPSSSSRLLWFQLQTASTKAWTWSISLPITNALNKNNRWPSIFQFPGHPTIAAHITEYQLNAREKQKKKNGIHSCDSYKSVCFFSAVLPTLIEVLSSTDLFTWS